MIVVAICVANWIKEWYEYRQAWKALEEYARIMRGEDE